ncbi:hypothetical protein EVAR_93655_1 [Eumeta japonica]|uniref:Uncharacterized protein n=1 Tax=Eumeta variegata TaxID=151549 RepID=A0A4C1TQP1_EUMVA|nr:hypothetical protein EVAR_93655_1 [Eumeta japonica]
METRKPTRGARALPASWEGIGYLVKEDWVEERVRGGMGYRNFYRTDAVVRRPKLSMFTLEDKQGRRRRGVGGRYR